jgi:hypothetical protein
MDNQQKVSRDYAIIEKMRAVKSNSPEYSKLRNSLFNLYKPLVYKMKNNLIARASGIQLRIDHEVEDYEMIAFEKLVMAIDSIDLAKVKDPAKFFLYIQYLGYLRSLNRDLIGHRIALCRKESQILTAADLKDQGDQPSKKNFIEAQECGRTKSAEEETLLRLQTSLISRAVDYCLNQRFNDIQKKIFYMKEGRWSLKDITKELQIKSSAYYKELNGVRAILKETLVRMSQEEKMDLELAYLK